MNEFGVNINLRGLKQRVEWEDVFSALENQFGEIVHSKANQDNMKKPRGKFQKKFTHVYFLDQKSFDAAIQAGSVVVGEVSVPVKENKRTSDSDDTHQDEKLKRIPRRNIRRLKAKEATMVAENTVFVKSIPEGEGKESLEKPMSTFGLVKSISFHLETKRKSAFAFVEFEDEKSANDAVLASNSGSLSLDLDKRRIIPNRADGDRKNESGSGNEAGGNDGASGRKKDFSQALNVDNVAIDTTEEEILLAFSKFGEIERVWTQVKDEMALVNFVDSKVVDAVLESSNSEAGIPLKGDDVKLTVNPRRVPRKSSTPTSLNSVQVTCLEAPLVHDEIHNALSNFGEIESLVVLPKRCFVIVVFSNAENANTAVECWKDINLRTEEDRELVVRLKRKQFSRRRNRFQNHEGAAPVDSKEQL